MKTVFLIMLYLLYCIFPGSALAAKRVTGYGYSFFSWSYMGYYLENTHQTADKCDSSCYTGSLQQEPVGLYLHNTSFQGGSFQLGTTLDPDFFLDLDYLFFTQKYGSPLDPDLSGYVKTQILSLNFQSELNVSGPMRYYIGCGIGSMRLNYTGTINGHESGIMFSGKLGMLYLASEYYGIFTEAQYIKGYQLSGDIIDKFDTKGYAITLGFRAFLTGRK